MNLTTEALKPMLASFRAQGLLAPRQIVQAVITLSGGSEPDAVLVSREGATDGTVTWRVTAVAGRQLILVEGSGPGREWEMGNRVMADRLEAVAYPARALGPLSLTEVRSYPDQYESGEWAWWVTGEVQVGDRQVGLSAPRGGQHTFGPDDSAEERLLQAVQALLR